MPVGVDICESIKLTAVLNMGKNCIWYTILYIDWQEKGCVGLALIFLPPPWWPWPDSSVPDPHADPVDPFSIADPGCLSSWFLPIPDLWSLIQKQQQKGGWKKLVVTFFCSHKFHIIENYFVFEMLKKKNLGQFSNNYRTFYSKNCH